MLYSLSACLEDRHQNPPSWTQQTEQHGLGCPRPAMVLVVDLTEAQLEFESDHAWRVKFAELEDEVREVSGVSWQASCPARFVFFFCVCVPFSSVGAARGVKNAPVHMARDTAGTRPCP